MDNNIKIKIYENMSDKNLEVPKISLQYSSKKVENSQISYDIISRLKAEDNIIIGLNSSFLNLRSSDTKAFLSNLIELLENMGLEYRNKKILVNAKRTILSFSTEGKKTEGFELIAFIPHKVWCDGEVRKIIPNIGVSYYILKSSYEHDLDTFINLDEDGKNGLCSMVIFDYILLGNMGINTSILKKDDIIQLLNK